MKKVLALLVSAFILVQGAIAFAESEPLYTADFSSEEVVFGGSPAAWSRPYHNQGISVQDNALKYGVAGWYYDTVVLDEYVPTGSYRMSFDLATEYCWVSNGYAGVILNYSNIYTNSYMLKTLTSGSGSKTLQLCNGPLTYVGNQQAVESAESKSSVNNRLYHYDITVNKETGTIETKYEYNGGEDTFTVNLGAGVNLNGKIAFQAAYAKATLKNLKVYALEEETATVSYVGASAQHDNNTGVLQFAYQVDGGDADSAGACMVPVSVFTNDTALEAGNSPIAKVTISESVSDGETFGVRLTNIPSSQFGTSVYAKGFIKIGNDVTWADKVSSSVNDAIGE